MMTSLRFIAIAATLVVSACALDAWPRQVKVGDAIYLVSKPEPLLSREVTALTIHRAHVSTKPGSGVALNGPHAPALVGEVIKSTFAGSLAYTCPLGAELAVDPQQPTPDGRVEVFLQCVKKTGP